MGTGIKLSNGASRSIRENLPRVTEKYPYKKGYFGEPGQGRIHTRNIVCTDPIAAATDFYRRIAFGGIERIFPKGKYTTLSDGTIISFRITSSSDGSPVVEINIRNTIDSGGVKYQKIHFMRGGVK